MQTIKNIFFYYPHKLTNFNFIHIIDKLLKSLFLEKTIKSYEKLGKPYGIIINDNMLKFHNKDIRKQIKKELIG